MKIIISPTKQMKAEQDFFFPESKPLFLDDTQKILDRLNELSVDDLKVLWKCSDKLVQENVERLQSAELNKLTTPAVMSYKGLQYQYMAPDLLTEAALDYLQEHLRILSGFYGMLRPFDGIVPYRLEMQTPLTIDETSTLYQFWGEKLYQALFSNQEPVINLASKEYSKAITPYLKKADSFIDIHFYNLVNDKFKVKATLAKMARGEMVRYLAENKINTIEGIKQFEHPHYFFSKEHSTDNQLVFIYQ